VKQYKTVQTRTASTVEALSVELNSFPPEVPNKTIALSEGVGASTSCSAKRPDTLGSTTTPRILLMLKVS
jgi:hypothetical protein